MKFNKLPKDAGTVSAGAPQSAVKTKASLVDGSIIVTHTLNAEYPVEGPSEIVNVTRGMVRERAVELAVTNRRLPHEVSKSNWEDAKREMIGLP